ATAAKAIDEYAAWFEKEQLPKANGSYGVGRANPEARYRAEELIDLPAATLLSIGERELAKNEAAFAAAATRVDRSRAPLAAGGEGLNDHPKQGQVVAAGQKAVEELQAYVAAKQLVRIP